MAAPDIRVTGTLSRDAESRACTDGTWWLFLELHLGPGGLPYTAGKCIGHGVPGDLASKSMARQMRRGTTVTVHATRCRYVFGPTPHLQLLNVLRIDYPVAWAYCYDSHESAA